jgi:hypothetical protein
VQKSVMARGAGGGGRGMVMHPGWPCTVDATRRSLPRENCHEVRTLSPGAGRGTRQSHHRRKRASQQFD